MGILASSCRGTGEGRDEDMQGSSSCFLWTRRPKDPLRGLLLAWVSYLRVLGK